MPRDSKSSPQDRLAFGAFRAAISLIALTLRRRRGRSLLMLFLVIFTLALTASIYSRRSIAAPHPLHVELEQQPGSEAAGTSSLALVSNDFPLPNLGNLQVHDPNILAHNGELYLFQGAVGIDIFKATNISGPWTKSGTVLSQQSIINKPDINRQRPWAPTTIEHNNTFYCFYSVTNRGTRNSAIGVATSNTLEPGSWTDHGAVLYTYEGPNSNVHPFTMSNAIDPAPFVDPVAGKGWLTFGSFWTDIWQVPLASNLLGIDNPSHPAANQLSYLATDGQSNSLLSWYPLKTDPQGPRPEEGSYISYRAPYYYLWYSRGKCCKFDPNNLPPPGTEYSIRVGRSMNVTGPYVDIDGVQLLKGGGGIVYGSNHDNVVYAPGGLGVLSLDDGTDLLYYHYINKTIGFGDQQTQLGWNVLLYNNGWPVVSNQSTTSSVPSTAVHLSNVSAVKNLGISITTAWLIIFLTF